MQNRAKCTEFLAIIMFIPHRTVVEHLGVFLLAQRLGQGRQRIIGDVILQRVRNGIVELRFHRTVAALDVFVDVRTHQVVLARRGSRLVHPFVSQVDVEVAQALHPGIHDDRNARVTFHGQGFPSVQLPFREPAVFLVHAHHGPDHVHLTFRINQGHQLMDVAVRVPQREYRIAVMRSGQDGIAFHHRILAVHVLQDVRMNHGVIQSGVEDTLLFLGSAFHQDTAQVFVPFFAGIGTQLVEGRAGRLFGIQVQTGIFNTSDGHFQY